jgi:hypothetical protein
MTMQEKQQLSTMCKSHPSQHPGMKSCAALKLMLCEIGDCPFFKTQNEYNEQLRSLKAAGKIVMSTKEYRECMSRSKQ